LAQQNRVHRYLQILQDSLCVNLINDLLDLQRRNRADLVLEEIHLHSFFAGSDRAFQEVSQSAQHSGNSLPHLYAIYLV